jgi:hypothetical protein
MAMSARGPDWYESTLEAVPVTPALAAYLAYERRGPVRAWAGFGLVTAGVLAIVARGLAAGGLGPIFASAAGLLWLVVGGPFVVVLVATQRGRAPVRDIVLRYTGPIEGRVHRGYSRYTSSLDYSLVPGNAPTRVADPHLRPDDRLPERLLTSSRVHAAFDPPARGQLLVTTDGVLIEVRAEDGTLLFRRAHYIPAPPEA